MKVLLLSNMYPSRANPAYGTFVYSQVRQMSEVRGLDFHLVVSRQAPQSRWGKLTKYLWIHLRCWAALAKRFDLVHLHYGSWPHFAAAWPVLLLKKRPLVVTLHRGDLYEDLPRSGWRRRLARRFLARADWRIAVSDDLRKRLEHLGLGGERTSVINVGCDTDLFRPAEGGEKERLRRKLGLPLDKPVFLFVGRISGRKGLDILFEALRLRDELPPMLTVLVGDGPDRDALQRTAQRFGLEKQIRWVGQKPNLELPDWYAACDWFVLPSRSEGTPTVLLEAMASALPPLASRVGGIPEVVEHRRNGLLFDSEDPRQLGACLFEAASSSTLQSRLARAALQSASQHSLQKQTLRIEQIYRRCIGRDDLHWAVAERDAG